jgi:hypothetical protein
MLRLNKFVVFVGITQFTAPLEKTTLSVEPGTPEGLQLEAVLQLVLPVETHVFITA